MELNTNQLAAVHHLNGPCCVIAGAGSGKTAVLTTRIKELLNNGVQPQKILAITFSQKATAEMRSRVKLLVGEAGVCISTFHSLGLRILRASGYTKGRELIREYQKIQFIDNAMNGTILEELDAAPKHVSSVIGILKGTLHRPEECLGQPDLPKDLAAIYEVYRAYEEYKLKNGFFDYDDMTDLPVYLLKENHALRNALKSRWEYILVDEYQDTNPAQDALLRLISPAGDNIFVVGDDYQSIYGFRGADVRNILNFPKKYPQTQMIYLDTNYRSTPEIVEASNALIQRNVHQFPKTVKSNRKPGRIPEVTVYEDEKAEADGIARQIKRLAEAGSKYSDMAILFRTNAASRTLEEALLLRNVPFTVQGGSCFWEQSYVTDVLDYLRLAIHPEDSGALLRILNRPNRFLGHEFRNAIIDYMERTGTSARSALEQNSLSKDWRYQKRVDQLLTQLLWLEQNAQSSLSSLLHYIYEYIGYKEFLRTDASEELFEERMESVEELLSLGEQFDTAEDLLEYVEIQMLSYRRNSQSQDAVTLSTIHKSKGLEYHTVFIISCIDGIMPHAEAKDIEEERRMLYVAMTRATDLLELSTIRYFRNRPASVSPFFADMEKQIKVKNAPSLRIAD